MSTAPHYTPHHPKWYRRRVSVWWWLQRSSSTVFVFRELTSIAVAFFALVCLWLVRALAQGPETYARFLACLRTPVFLGLHAIAFVCILFHAVTWFNLAPKAMVVRLRGRRLPDGIIAGANYAAWLVLSGAVTWILLRG